MKDENIAYHKEVEMLFTSSENEELDSLNIHDNNIMMKTTSIVAIENDAKESFYAYFDKDEVLNDPTYGTQKEELLNLSRDDLNQSRDDLKSNVDGDLSKNENKISSISLQEDGK